VQSNQADSEGRRFEVSLSGDYRQTLSSENFVFAGGSIELHLVGVAKPNQVRVTASGSKLRARRIGL
jgi:hypothetical protein